MTDQEAYEAIGKRAAELAALPEIKAACEKMFMDGKSKEDIEAYVYRIAIATLCGIK